jgi:hypothetical protein
MSTTTDLTKFGHREREMLIELLQAWNVNGLPEDFEDNQVHPMFNMDSGNVFLTNEDFQVAMINNGKLESFYNSPYNGLEGFFDELKEQYAEMHNEDREWFRNLAESLGRLEEVSEDATSESEVEE